MELDNVLGVAGWAILPTQSWHVVERPEGAPAWWVDDEEAAESFLKAAPPRRVKAKK